MSISAHIHAEHTHTQTRLSGVMTGWRIHCHGREALNKVQLLRINHYCSPINHFKACRPRALETSWWRRKTAQGDRNQMKAEGWAETEHGHRNIRQESVCAKTASI